MADEFPWVNQIKFQDSITWVGTNDGLYKIVISKDKKIRWSKELEKGTDFIIDSEGTIWASNFGKGLNINNGHGWQFLQNDTVKYIYNIYEYKSQIFILANINETLCYLKWDKSKWVFLTSFNPSKEQGKVSGFGLVVDSNGIYSCIDFYEKPVENSANCFYQYDWEKWNVVKKDVTDFFYENISDKWYLFNSNDGRKFIMNNLIITLPNKEVINKRFFSVKGVLWILTTNGNFYKYLNNNWIKYDLIENTNADTYYLKNENEVWAGGYSYVAYYEKGKWIEVCFLEPRPNGEETGESEEELQKQREIEASKTWGVINDPDGYTNLREMPNPDSDIVAIILKNVKFKYREVYKMDWCYVETMTGAKGYMHKSRITKI